MKKAIAFALVLALLLSLSACVPGVNNVINTNTNNSSNTAVQNDVNTLAGTYRIVVWCPVDAAYLIVKQIADFNASNGHGIIIEATVENKTVEEAGASFPAELSEAPDLFVFSQADLSALVRSGAVDALSETAAKNVRDSSDANAAAAAGIGESIYAYPLTSDGGYVMYYNKSVIPESDTDSLEKLLADCAEAEQSFSMMAGTARGLVSFFFGTGCVSAFETDEDGNVTGINDTFNSAGGMAAAKALYALVSSEYFKSSDNPSSLVSQSAAVISDMGALMEAREVLGEDLGVADLPSFAAGGASFHMGSFSGCKLLGVKHQEDARAANVLGQLAQFLAEYDRQMERFKTLGWGPSNLKAQGTDAVKSNAAVAALAEQNRYAVLEGQTNAQWWEAAQKLASDIADSDGSDEALQEALDSYTDSLNSLLATEETETETESESETAE